MILEKQKYYQTEKNTTISRHYNAQETQVLKEHLAKGFFKVYLQPKVRAKSGAVCGMEALARYCHPKYGVVPPGKFIQRFENSGSVKYLDMYMVESVCRLQRKWLDMGIVPMCVSVNISRATMIDENLAEDICRIADKYNVPHRLLEIEITESFSNLEKSTISVIANKIAQKGFLLALDDFGAKYSNLAVLSAANWSTIKLDKSLVNDIISNSRTQLVMKSLFDMCRKININSVAEGVETKEQYNTIVSLGCNEIQGYYFAKPMPVEDFEEKYLIK